MARTLSTAKDIDIDVASGNDPALRIRVTADRAKVLRYHYAPDSSLITGVVCLYESGDNAKNLNVHVQRDLSSLAFSTLKSEWETYNSPSTWVDTISVLDMVHSLLLEQVASDLTANTLTLQGISGGTIVSVADAA